MVKDFLQRGFRTERESTSGDLSYFIDYEGFENLVVERENRSVMIQADNGVVRSVFYEIPQARIMVYADSETPTTHSNLSEETIRANITQAQRLYDHLIRLLNVDEKLKDYRPEFREKTELTPIKVLKIKSIDEIDLLDRMMGK